MFGSPASSAGAGSETPSTASSASGTPSTGRYGYRPSPPPENAAFMTGTLNTLKSLEEPRSPLSLGSPAKTFNPPTTLQKMSNRAEKIKSRVQSGLSGIRGEESKKAEESVRLWIKLLENQYEYEDAEKLKHAFFETRRGPRIGPESRSASGPAKIGAEPSSERYAQIVPVGARGKSSADYEEKVVFDMRKYYDYIRYKLASEGKGDLLSGLMDQLYALQNGVGNEAESSRLEDIITQLHEVERNQNKKEEEIEAIRRLEETHAETDARLDMEEKAKREAFNKRREAAAEAYAIINNVEKPKIKGLKNLVAEIQAKIRAKAGGGRIYTLRAKRRNVRNKEKRRTRKGLVRQGSRPDRKTRRRA